MLIRSARKADAPALAQLARELADHVADPDPGIETRELVALGFGEGRWFDCLVAESDSRVVGFASYCKRFEIHTRSRKLWLGDLIVASGYRGRGVGEALVAELRRRAIEMGCDALVLELWAENELARSFYRKLGAKPQEKLEVLLIPARAY